MSNESYQGERPINNVEARGEVQGQSMTGPQHVGGYADGSIPPYQSPGKPVTIQPVHHGFFVSVGCQQFAVETVDALLHRLGGYLKNPGETEKMWMSGNLKF